MWCWQIADSEPACCYIQTSSQCPLIFAIRWRTSWRVCLNSICLKSKNQAVQKEKTYNFHSRFPPEFCIEYFFFSTQTIPALLDRVMNCSLAVKVIFVSSCQPEGLRDAAAHEAGLYFLHCLLGTECCFAEWGFPGCCSNCCTDDKQQSLFLTDVMVNTTRKTGSWCLLWSNTCWAGMPQWQPCISVSGFFCGRGTSVNPFSCTLIFVLQEDTSSEKLKVSSVRKMALTQAMHECVSCTLCWFFVDHRGGGAEDLESLAKSLVHWASCQWKQILGMLRTKYCSQQRP